MKLVIGLIGGIGSGKSSAGAALAKRGARVISGDALGHEALRDAEIKKQIIEHWGNRVLDRQREIDRSHLGAIVFENPEERRKLEAIVHPYIKRRLAEEIAAAQADKRVKLIVVDAAVMLEAGWNKHCDRILFVEAPRKERLKRLAQQRGWTAKELTAREDAQMPLNEKKAFADAVLDNSGPVEQLQGEIDKLLKSWTNKENFDHG